MRKPSFLLPLLVGALPWAQSVLGRQRPPVTPVPASQPATQPGSQPGSTSRPGEPPSNPLAGIWQLTRAVRIGTGDAPREVRGYLVFTRTHLSMHMWENAPMAASPRVQSSFRICKVSHDQIVSTGLLGFLAGEDGQLVREPGQAMERRKYALLDGGTQLRIYQNDAMWIELRRIED